MRILLVFPTHLNRRGRPVKYKAAYMPPLALGILNGLIPAYHQVSVVNDFVEPIDFSVAYDLVAITMLTSQAPRAYQIADRFRANGARIVLGGIHASTLPEEAARHADAVVIGEVEHIWEQILTDCENGRLQPRYQQEDWTDLQQMVLPRWDNFNLGIYRRYSSKEPMPRMPIFTTRGCIFNCKYCSVSKFFGRTYRFKPVSHVLNEIESTGAYRYFFIDDNIVCEPDYAQELFTALKGRRIRWNSQCSVHILRNPHLIDLAASAGCRNLLIGVESISKESLKAMKKSFNKPEQYAELFNRMVAAGIRPYVSLIYGLDSDSPEQLIRTIEFFKKANVWNLIMWLLTPLPGTELFEEFEAENRILDRDWSKYDATQAVFQPRHFTLQELDLNYWKAYQSFYTFPSIAGRLIKTVLHLDRPIKHLMEDLLLQIYIHKRLHRMNNPVAMGIDRLTAH
jgi:radical SAM superfamily enzyme YgiQ (UPF0313 family)